MLFIVATPIGNLDDISYRQAKTLLWSDIILAEDTRSAQIILQGCQTRFKLPNKFPKLISYYKDKEFEKLPQILSLLKEEINISLISESGMPLINDPGYLLVKTCIKENIPFSVIPGSSAITTSLLYSGFNPEKFIFLGYLPKKKSDLIHYFNSIKKIKQLLSDIIIVVFESALRINKTMEELDEELPQINVCICRELTKKFEEIIRGKPKDLINRRYKGEITILLF